MARPRRNANLVFRSKRANHGRKPCKGKLKSRFVRDRRRSR
ncbi:MAG TPA: hypothetical protein PLP01_00695 [Phycisphaerae bacterium]|nr:hypothetical protein [Phycisphaerae bacterium]